MTRISGRFAAQVASLLPRAHLNQIRKLRNRAAMWWPGLIPASCGGWIRTIGIRLPPPDLAAYPARTMLAFVIVRVHPRRTTIPYSKSASASTLLPSSAGLASALAAISFNDSLKSVSCFCMAAGVVFHASLNASVPLPAAICKRAL